MSCHMLDYICETMLVFMPWHIFDYTCENYICLNDMTYVWLHMWKLYLLKWHIFDYTLESSICIMSWNIFDYTWKTNIWFKHILLSNIYNGIEHKFYNLYKVIYPVSYIHRSDREHDE